jgi:adenosylcobinamide kinase/adenosylcobinamide-phosphate guanylyltransferase
VPTLLYDVTGSDGDRLLYATDTGPLPARTLEAVRGAAYGLVLVEQTFGDVLDHGTRHLDLATPSSSPGCGRPGRSPRALTSSPST